MGYPTTYPTPILALIFAALFNNKIKAIMQNLVFTQLSAKEFRQLLQEEISKALAEYSPSTTTTPTKEILSFTEGCEYLDISKSYGYKLTSKQELPHYKRGKKIYFKRVELDEWMLTKKVDSFNEIEASTNDYLKNRKGAKS